MNTNNENNTEAVPETKVPVLDNAMFELMMAKLQEDVLEGNVSQEHLKMFQKAVKPKTAAQIAREAAVSAIADFKTLTEFDAYENFGALILDYETLVGELKTCRGSATKKATKKCCLSGPETNFLISLSVSEGNDCKMGFHPGNNRKCRRELLGLGYTNGQASAFANLMPWRKNIGYIPLE